MRLFEAIMDANHRALAGDATAGLHLNEFADALPIAALTCIDARLNPLFPEVLGVTKEHFIWLRNAGNIITGPMSSTMRSLALGCAVKGGREIAIIGHNDCQVCKTSVSKLTDAFRAIGVERGGLPENLTEFFGLFASERQNVIKAVEYVRHSPLIGPKISVHGLMVDIGTGKLEWVVNGYQAFDFAAAAKAAVTTITNDTKDAFKSLADFKIGEMRFPDTKIGELAKEGKDWLAREIQSVESAAIGAAPVAPAPPEAPRSVEAPKAPPVVRTPPIAPRIPAPPVVRPGFRLPGRKF